MAGAWRWNSFVSITRKNNWSGNSVAGIAITLRAERSGIRIPVREKDFSLLRNVHADYGAFIPWDTAALTSI